MDVPTRKRTYATSDSHFSIFGVPHMNALRNLGRLPDDFDSDVVAISIGYCLDRYVKADEKYKTMLALLNVK